jgi:peptidoglycan/LPS O-acetylase OafA/YrhL
MAPDDARARPTFADRLYLRLRRITASGVFILEIEGLLFIATALVFGEALIIHFIAWSLEVEVQFYLLVPLLARVFAVRHAWARRAILTAAAFGLVLACQMIGVEDFPRLRLSVVNYGQYFLAGFLLADLYVDDCKGRPTRHAAWDLVSLAGWPTFFLLTVWDTGRAFLFPPLILLLYGAVLRGVWFRTALTNRWVVVTGGMCYSLYLVHGVFIVVFGRWTTRPPEPSSYDAYCLMQVALLVPVILVGCAVFFVLFEKPCMRRDWPHALYRWA